MMTGVLISDQFIDGVYNLPKEIAYKVWKALRMLFHAPQSGGLNLEHLKDHLYSMRVDLQYRIILRKEEDRAPALLFVGKHDEAYRFAERTQPLRAPRLAFLAMTGTFSLIGLLSHRETYRVPREPAPIEVVGTLIRTREYLPLAKYLLSRDATKNAELKFREIEDIVGNPLPQPAAIHRAWWANDPTHVQATAWLAVGWEVEAVDSTAKIVEFRAAHKAHIVNAV